MTARSVCAGRAVAGGRRAGPYVRLQMGSLPARLHPDDLVDDRALTSVDDDQLEHRHLVCELVSVVQHVPTPNNIALYAPWGSGKSGIARLLENSFADDDAVRFVRFDASKYAQTPLRRHFISQTAAALRQQDVKLSEGVFDAGLYTDVKQSAFELPRRQMLRLVVLLIGALAVFAALGLAAAVVYSWCAVGPSGPAFGEAVRYLLPKLLLVGPVLTATATFAVKRMPEQTLAAPSSEEQFQQLFEQLAAEATRGPSSGRLARCWQACRAWWAAKRKKTLAAVPTRRLVVFIDELDRCAPNTVVDVLTTLWTFFDVANCVFVVAADQQVLEEALTQAAAQATPLDHVNPYYTAGSAYLDKVFHLQMALPPLKAQRLSLLAKDLVKDKDGIWGQLRDAGSLDVVISTLVPSHVRSPRRVKALLNQFALSYRVAEQRANANMLSDLLPRAAELAKLACLRVEFPLFAAELVTEPRLARWVTGELDRLDADNEQPEAIPDHVDEQLKKRIQAWAKGDVAPDRLIHRSRPPAQDPAADDATSEDRVEQAHAQQLLSYLRKTRKVEGPAADLIFLDTAGADLGVDPTAAAELEQAAANGERHRVGQLIGNLPEDQRAPALRLLARVAQHSAIGLEAANVTGSLLEAVASAGDAFRPAADEVAAALADDRYRLDDADLAGALKLSLASEHPNARGLRSKVLSDERLLADHVLCAEVVQAAGQLQQHLARVAEAFTELLITGNHAAAALRGLSDETINDVIEAASDPLSERAGSLDSAGPISGELDELLDLDRNVAGAVAAVLLTVTTPASGPLQDVVNERLDRIGPVTDSALAHQLVDLAAGRPGDQAARWISVIDPQIITADEFDDCTAALTPIIINAWQNQSGPQRVEHVTATLQHLQPFIDRKLLATSDELDAAVLEPFASLRSDPQEATWTLQAADALAHAGLADRGDVADHILELVSTTVSRAVNVTNGTAEAIWQIADRVLRSASAQARSQIAALADNGYWTAVVANLRLRAAAVDDTDCPYDTAQIASFVSSHMPLFRFGLATWLEHWSQTVDDVAVPLKPLIAEELHAEVAAALTEVVRWWDENHPERRGAYIEQLILGATHVAPSPQLLKLTQADRQPAQTLTTAFAQAATTVSTAAEADALLMTWTRLSGPLRSQTAKLIDDVLTPMLELADPTVLDAVCHHLGLVADTKDPERDRIRRRVRKAAKLTGQTQEVEDHLVDAGLLKRQRLRRGTKEA